jgi:hypothetical protein
MVEESQGMEVHMGAKKCLKGTVRLARATAGMTKFLDIPIQTEPEPANNVQGIYYPNIEDRFENLDCIGSDTEVIDA